MNKRRQKNLRVVLKSGVPSLKELMQLEANYNNHEFMDLKTLKNNLKNRFSTPLYSVDETQSFDDQKKTYSPQAIIQQQQMEQEINS